MSAPVIELEACDQVHLNNALLCQDCKTISRGRDGACVACASSNLLALAPVLDREKKAGENESDSRG